MKMLFLLAFVSWLVVFIIVWSVIMAVKFIF